MKKHPISYTRSGAKKRGIRPNDPYMIRGLDGEVIWLQYSVIHCKDGPAVIDKNYERWVRFGKTHRVDGPAVVYKDGDLSWYVNGTQIFDYDQYQQVTNSSDEEMLLLKLKWGKMYPFEDSNADPADRH